MLAVAFGLVPTMLPGIAVAATCTLRHGWLFLGPDRADNGGTG